jgi:hypothetical protein
MQSIHRPSSTVDKPSTSSAAPDLPPTPTSSEMEAIDISNLQKIRHGLLRAIPCSMDIKILMESMKQISMFAYESYYKSSSPKHEDCQKIHTSLKSLLYPEAHPVSLARQMLLFAAAMRYVPPAQRTQGLSKHYSTIIEDLVEAATQMVTMNDALAGTLEHLQTIVLEMFCHVDSGNIRRAWMTVHRAVMVSKLLGLQSPEHYRYKLLSIDCELYPQSLWLCIICMDRVLSLLLGLPTAISTA